MQKLKILDLRFARLLSVYIKTSSSSKYDYVNISRFPPSVRYTSQCVPGTSSSSKYEYSTGINISRFPPYRFGSLHFSVCALKHHHRVNMNM